MLLSIAVIVAHTVALHYLFAWTARRLPPSPEVDLSHLTPEERHARGKRFDRLTVVPMFLLWPVLGAGWLLAFQALAWWLPNRHPGVAFVVCSNPYFRWMTALYAGLLLSGAVSLLVLRLAFGRVYHEWMACRDEVYFRVSVRRFVYVCVVWAVPLFLEWDYHWASAYVVFTDDAVVIKEVWSLQEEGYPYERVADIEMVNQWVPDPDHEFLPTPGVRITFDDGRRWTNAGSCLWFTPDDLAAVELTSRKSGKPVRPVPAL